MFWWLSNAVSNGRIQPTEMSSNLFTKISCLIPCRWPTWVESDVFQFAGVRTRSSRMIDMFEDEEVGVPFHVHFANDSWRRVNHHAWKDGLKSSPWNMTTSLGQLQNIVGQDWFSRCRRSPVCSTDLPSSIHLDESQCVFSCLSPS